MKKIPFLATLIFTFLCLTVLSHATVVVYKGTATRFKALGNNPATKVSTLVYFVVQFDGANTGQNYFVFSSAAKKTYSQLGPRGFGLNAVNTAPTVTDFLVSDVATGNSSHYTRFQGVVSALKLNSGNPATSAFPRSFTGTYSDFDTASGLTLFLIPAITLNFDAARTQAANALTKDAATVANDIAGEFASKPFWVVGS
jgi:hypothetical protein